MMGGGQAADPDAGGRWAGVGPRTAGTIFFPSLGVRACEVAADGWLRFPVCQVDDGSVPDVVFFRSMHIGASTGGREMQGRAYIGSILFLLVILYIILIRIKITNLDYASTAELTN